MQNKIWGKNNIIYLEYAKNQSYTFFLSHTMLLHIYHIHMLSHTIAIRLQLKQSQFLICYELSSSVAGNTMQTTC